jgi:hypothetical protein
VAVSVYKEGVVLSLQTMHTLYFEAVFIKIVLAVQCLLWTQKSMPRIDAGAHCPVWSNARVRALLRV